MNIGPSRNTRQSHQLFCLNKAALMWPFILIARAHLSCINTVLADSALSLHTEQATCIRTHTFTEFTPSARNVHT